MAVPVMELRWGRVGYLASVILPIFEHVYDITKFPRSAGRGPWCEYVTAAACHENGRVVVRIRAAGGVTEIRRVAPPFRAGLSRGGMLVHRACGRGSCRVADSRKGADELT
jgi:hypothetical protein